MSTFREIDLLAPLEIWEVLLDDRAIKFHTSLVLKPVPLPPEESDGKTYLSIDVPELNISAHADNREDLLEFVHSDIRFAWRRCVEPESDESLSSAAQKRAAIIRDNYLAIAEIVTG